MPWLHGHQRKKWKNKIKQMKQKTKSGVFNYLNSTVSRFWPKNRCGKNLWNKTEAIGHLTVSKESYNKASRKLILLEHVDIHIKIKTQTATSCYEYTFETEERHKHKTIKFPEKTGGDTLTSAWTVGAGTSGVQAGHHKTLSQKQAYTGEQLYCI